jgi:multidrug efflux pump subunit AcrB
MNGNEHNHLQEEIQDHIAPQYSHMQRWKRIHHTWSFWVFLFLMFVAIMYYITSVDFAFAPR